MNKSLVVLIAAVSLFCSPFARAASAAESDIPTPKFTAQQAIEKVAKYYRESKGDPESFIISIAYGRPDRMRSYLVNNFVRGDDEEWSWFVTYSHPKKDESTIYRIRDNGEIYPLMQTRS